MPILLLLFIQCISRNVVITMECVFLAYMLTACSPLASYLVGSGMWENTTCIECSKIIIIILLRRSPNCNEMKWKEKKENSKWGQGCRKQPMCNRETIKCKIDRMCAASNRRHRQLHVLILLCNGNFSLNCLADRQIMNDYYGCNEEKTIICTSWIYPAVSTQSHLLFQGHRNLISTRGFYVSFVCGSMLGNILAMTAHPNDRRTYVVALASARSSQQ